ncbi:rrna-processing protein efg1 [Malassezia pachydermatis]|uniref:rRNA-processing protein EFG1 n=1 Tax=Malassezia pachydermatis TaxID=77020 RepID=A0A0M8MM05_9BASI|nr:rrna-processing protein efg1 [Malassezia pachydermatis]KOS14268.1 rrna-processing protein efg1 [Malassezia pachydermatis]
MSERGRGRGGGGARGRGRGRGGARNYSKSQPRDVTGVNKLKSIMRQTKRLLSKDSITPGARIEAERRLLAIERELEERAQSNKERTLAARYHKVKFFERQKLVRRIKQLLRSIDASENTKSLRAELYESRVFLNYVLRYVALFGDRGAKKPIAPGANASDRAQKQAAEFLHHNDDDDDNVDDVDDEDDVDDDDSSTSADDDDDDDDDAEQSTHKGPKGSLADDDFFSL